VNQVLRQSALEMPEPTEWVTQPVRDVPVPPPLPPAPVHPEDTYAMAFATAASHSRVPAAVPDGVWSIRWELPLASSPGYVLQAGDRAIAFGGGRWELFDLAGKAIASGRYTTSMVSANAPSNRFYFVDENNFLLAHQLSSGRLEFMFPVTYGETFIRPHLFQNGRRILWTAYERDTYPHAPQRAPRSLVEMRELGDKLETDAIGLLFSLTADVRLYLATRVVSSAALGDEIVLAVPGAIYRASDALEPRTVMETESAAEPLGLSLDETRRIYLVTKQSEDRTLWIIAPDGRRAVVPLAREWGDFIAPPVVGYDHRVFLVTGSRAVAFGPDGKLQWDVPPGGHIAGVTVSADGILLLSAGARIVGLNPKGESRVLRDFEGDSLSTPPVLMPSGQMLVASAKKLYCLIAR